MFNLDLLFNNKDITTVETVLIDAFNNFDALPLPNEEIKLYLCYPKTNYTHKTEIFLFNKINISSLNYIATHTHIEQNKISLVISQVDKNFLTIFKKTTMFIFRQTYTIILKQFQIGDVLFKIGSIFKEENNKKFFLEVELTYGTNYNNSAAFLFDIIENIFPMLTSEEIKNACLLSNAVKEKYQIADQKKTLAKTPQRGYPNFQNHPNNNTAMNVQENKGENNEKKNTMHHIEIVQYILMVLEEGK